MAHTEKTRATAYAKMAERRVRWLCANGPCRDCGSGEKPEVHHLDPALKESHSVWSWREDRMLAELAKCIVLCQTCHRKRHAKALVHNASGYRRGCRCAACTEANVARVIAWRLKHHGTTSSQPPKSFAEAGFEPATSRL